MTVEILEKYKRFINENNIVKATCIFQSDWPIPDIIFTDNEHNVKEPSFTVYIDDLLYILRNGINIPISYVYNPLYRNSKLMCLICGNTFDNYQDIIEHIKAHFNTDIENIMTYNYIYMITDDSEKCVKTLIEDDLKSKMPECRINFELYDSDTYPEITLNFEGTVERITQIQQIVNTFFGTYNIPLHLISKSVWLLEENKKGDIYECQLKYRILEQGSKLIDAILNDL